MSVLSPADLQRIIDQILTAREQSLTRRSVRSILSSLDQVTQLWLDPSSEERQAAEAALPQETGLSAEMIRHALPLIFQEYRAERLEALLREELGDPNVLDIFIPSPGGRRRACGPELITQVLAGNLPGAGLDGVIFALLVKSATLVKTSSSAPLLPTLFARTLARVDPELSACLTVVSWPRESLALEKIAFSRADVVLAAGSEASLAAIRPHVRGQFIGYGHKLSFLVIGKEALAEAQLLAQAAAYDVALFDQQGCLSPQLVYVEEGGQVSPQEFAALLARQLEYWQKTLPRGVVPAEASVAIRRLRDEAEWQALAGKDVALYTSPSGTTWTVIYEADPGFVPSPLYRTVRVKPLASFADLEPLLTSWRPYLEAVGVAITPDLSPGAREHLSRLGVSRICQIGAMQTPPLSWRHGGRPRIADLVRWVGIEA
jgi:hypothetical protein